MSLDWTPARIASMSHTRNLAERESDGIRVSLDWTPARIASLEAPGTMLPVDLLTLTVHDIKTGHYAEVSVDPSDALYAYRHPYPYLASLQSRETAQIA